MIVYYVEGGVYRFVSRYRKGGLLSRARIYHSADICCACELTPSECTACASIIRSQGGAAKVTTKEEFTESHLMQRFWVIERENKDSGIDYYCGLGSNHRKEASRPMYTEDITAATASLSKSWFMTELNAIRMMSSDKVRVVQIYVKLTNKLLSAMFFITCTDKKQATYYLSGIQDNLSGELVLADKSADALRMTYEDAVERFEQLRSMNKGYLYAVWPEFTDNVDRRNIEDYVKRVKVMRSFAVEIRLKDFIG